MKPVDAETRMVGRCRDRGLPVTAQRRAVLHALAGRRDHPTAGQLHAGAAARVPGITRATVYRVLDALERLGVVRRLDHAGGGARYEVDLGPHHHLVCTACGRIADLHDPALDGLSVSASKSGGFTVHDYSIQFRGLCGGCRPTAAKTPERRKR